MTPDKSKLRKLEPFSFLQNQLPISSEFERLRYYAEDCRFMMYNLAVSSKLTAALFLLFGAVDFFVYPEFFGVFMGIRCVCAALLLSFIFISKSHWAKRRYRAFVSIVPLTAAFFLEIMIYLSGAPESVYYAGMTLCVVGTGTLYQWSSKEAALTCFVIIGMYMFPGLLQIRGAAAEMLVGFGMNCLFMISTGILVVIGTYYHYSFRCKEFLARSNLRRDQAALVQIKNQKIEQTAETLRRTENQLFQSEKMSLLGQLSSGVIHEVANPVNYTNQALDVLRNRIRKKKSAEEIEEVIVDMQEGLDRIRDIISELRGFAHIGRKGGERFYVHETVSSSLRLLFKQVSESSVDIRMEVDETLEIQGIKNQIVQVLTNLIHNALQAMEGGGEGGILDITSESISADLVLIRVKDNGPGIESDDLDSVFDPYFTTKDPGVGTGLGLSICYRIIESHGGTIEAFNDPDRGTVFEICLPVEASEKVYQNSGGGMELG